MSRKSIPDIQRAGRSRIVPYKTNEKSSERHSRRLQENLKRREDVQNYCTANRLNLKISNQGHHWQIFDENFLLEWWPSSAKIVINKKWNKGIHCHDHLQMLEILERNH